jgi:hypothetical protein
MDTQVIQLESFDNVNSVRSKMAWAKSGRILLVWPSRGLPLSRQLDLTLLQRHAASLGCQLALATDRPEAVENAHELGIPVFRSTFEAEQSTWRRGRRRKPLAAQHASILTNYRDLKGTNYHPYIPQKLDPLWIRLAAFSSGIIAILALVLFFLPSAKIQLSLVHHTQTLDLAVRANPKIATPNLSGGIPAHLIKVIVEGKDQIQSTGSQSIPDQPATGKVQITNLTENEITVPAGTIVLSTTAPAARFQTTDPLDVPAGAGTTAEVSIKAIQPGSGGNLEAGQIQAIEGPIGLSLTVTNPEATSGGADRSSLVPSEEDYQTLRDRLLERLQQSALNEISSRLSEGQQLIPAGVDVSNFLEENRQPGKGMPGDQLSLSMRVEYSGLYILDNDLRLMAGNALDAGLPENFSAVPETIKIEDLDKPSIDGDTIQWKVRVSQLIRTNWSGNELAEALAGHKPEEASGILKPRIELEKAPVVVINPSWWPRLPYLPSRISIEGQ